MLAQEHAKDIKHAEELAKKDALIEKLQLELKRQQPAGEGVSTKSPASSKKRSAVAPSRGDKSGERKRVKQSAGGGEVPTTAKSRFTSFSAKAATAEQESS